jgi:quinol monooxygenase YgiN
MRPRFTWSSSKHCQSKDKSQPLRILRYKDRAASDAHFQAPPVQKLVSLITNEGPLIRAPEIFELSPSFDFQRPITDATPGMLLVLAHVGFKAGKTTAALPAFKELISTCERTEPQFYGCTICEDKTNSTVRVVDLFESEKFFDEIHAKSEAIAIFQSGNVDLKNGEHSIVKLKIVQGFLGR